MKSWPLASRMATGVILSFLLLVLGIGRATADSSQEKAAELDRRVAYWKSVGHLPYCNWDFGAKFPSKYEDAAGADNETLKCNDGDSVGFNGLLCASGDSQGCDAVRRSQQPNGPGRWWRSPKRLYEGAAEGGSETTFSNDHALGVWAYIAQTKDKDAFRRWIDWIDNNPRCGASFKCIPLFPRYCADDRCTFKLIDCPLLDRLALILNESNPICDPLHNFSSAALLMLAEFQHQFDDIISDIYKIPGAQLLKPGIEALRNPFNNAVNVLREAIKKSEALRERMATYARATGGTDGLVSLVNSMFNESGYALDDVAFAIFDLRKYGGFNGAALSSAAEILVTREKENAFFEYVAHGPTEKMLDQILAKCPSQASDIPHARFQWIWQRDDNEQPPPSKKTMYWDCIFVANLYKDGPLPSIDIPAPPLLGEAYALSMKEVDNAVQLVQQILNALKQIEKDVADVGKTLEKAVQDAGKTIEKAGHDAGKTGEKAAQDTQRAVDKAAKDVEENAGKAVSDVQSAAAKAAQDAQDAAAKAARDAQNAAAKAAQDAQDAAAKAARDAQAAAEKAKRDTEAAARKAADDAARAAAKAAKDAANIAAAPIRKVFPHF